VTPVAGARIRLTPAEREALARWIVRAVVWLSERMGVPPWGAVLIVTGLIVAAGVVYAFWDDIMDWIGQWV
jgi:hypothetical protein